MNKIKTLSLFIALVVISVVGNAQFHIGAGAGFSSKTAIAGEVTMGYDFKVVNLEAGFLSHLSQAVDKGTIFNVKVGYPVRMTDEITILPAIGYSYTLKSNDDKQLNTRGAIYSLYVIKDIAYQAQLFTGLNYADKAIIGIVGLRLNLRNE